MRGESASKFRLGFTEEATDLAVTALDIHTQNITGNADGEARNALRERAQSAHHLGKIMLSGAVDAELKSGFNIMNNGPSSLKLLESANVDLLAIGGELTGDQHYINNAGPLALAYGLYGKSATRARFLAKEAFRRGWESESSKSGTAANISASYRLKAVGRAVGRGVAALAVNRLTANSSNGSRRRNLALKITKRVI